MENYLIAMGVTVGIYAVMALGLNITWGTAGMVNLGAIGFVAIGAYTSALSSIGLDLPIGVAMIAATLIAGLAGAFVAATTAGLRSDYLAIATLAASETVRIVATNETWLTNGTDGISGIPGPFRAMLSPLQFNCFYLALVVVIAACVYVLMQRLSYSPFGRVLRAIRDDDSVVETAGKSVLKAKVAAFSIGCGVLGLGGALYAHYTSFIVPDLFVPLFTLYIKLSLLIGGIGNNRGGIAGAFMLVLFLESTRFIFPYLPDLSPVQVAAARELLICAALLLVLKRRKRGLIPEPNDHRFLPTHFSNNNKNLAH